MYLNCNFSLVVRRFSDLSQNAKVVVEEFAIILRFDKMKAYYVITKAYYLISYRPVKISCSHQCLGTL